MTREMTSMDGNEAAAYVAHRTNEVIAIYPITPSSNMGEWADEWSSLGKKNIWGSVPSVVEMQSEGGASGAVHGSLQTGALTTTFTASQGLMLMIPNMFKIAGELTSTVFHIAARSIATHALSIFGDHSDVMATRSTGWAMLFSGSVQEVMDMALIAQAATLEARVPFLHAFDGFRTSHEVSKIETLADEDMKAMLPDDLIRAHRERALSPDRPFIRGTAQNPDVFFQGREAANKYYEAVPGIVQKTMDKFAKLVGRQYHLFDYVGAPDAERVVLVMGSATETVEETVQHLVKQGEKVGMVKVRLYRPLSMKALLAALPKSVKFLATLDRTKESGSMGEPLYQDVITGLAEHNAAGSLPFAMPRVIGGRYGLSSKEFTPAMAKAVFDEMKKKDAKNHFTVGINDDVTRTSLDFDPSFIIEAPDVNRSIFWGLGADGTVSANKNSIKIIGEETNNYGQGYFVYDSKKAGSITTSYLRFGPRPIKSPYLISAANFVAVHQFNFVERHDVLKAAMNGATFLLNSPFGPDEVWDKLPRTLQKQIIEKKIRFYVIDAYDVAGKTGMGVRINTIMQTCFFAISGVLPKDEAIEQIKKAAKKTYGRKGEEVVKKNFAAIDAAVAAMHEVKVPDKVTSNFDLIDIIPPTAPEFVRKVTGPIIAGHGDDLPVSVFPVDGTYPSATTRWEKRNIAQQIPAWDPALCIQCGKCTLVCPHACLRAKAYDASELAKAPQGFKSADAKWKELAGKKFTIQISPEDCTGCTLCTQVCPGKDKANPERKACMMEPMRPAREAQMKNWDFFLSLPEMSRYTGDLKFQTVKDLQLLRPLFEFSGACTGCGETPYVRVLTQLFGDRAIIANATGCSSIYGGNLPTTPYAINAEGRGPAWSNSLFEDNAEFGLGFRLSLDFKNAHARKLLERMKDKIGADLVTRLLATDQSTPAGIGAMRQLVAELKKKLAGMNDSEAKDLLALADDLVKRSVWILGGDGWAYDIGYGGLDHVLASGRNVNVLVLDTEVYSNTGGQASKATPIGAVARFTAGGKPSNKKDLGMMAMAYGNVYVANVAFGANDNQLVKAMLEAEAYDGPSIIIAYAHCINHNIETLVGIDHQKKAVATGYWPLFRYNPALIAQGKNPLQLDYSEPKVPVKEFLMSEGRFVQVAKKDPAKAEMFQKIAQEWVTNRWLTLSRMAAAEAPKA